MGFRLVTKSVTLNWTLRPLNGVMAIILRYFAEFGSFRSQLWLISHQQIFSRDIS